MKANIHPQWYHDCQVTCACGNTFVTGSTTQTLTVDICHKCHPFFTGEQRFVDRQGRVDRFKQKMMKASGQTTPNKKKNAKMNDSAPAAEAKSYQEILREQKTKLRQAANN